ncbi:MAG TPA: DUF3096 domain-containing protein, partial [Candidatus Binatia bacterium]|nr:DUF3096 domain-containing protein [Candidatus Binatia bacterium]
TSHGRGNTVVGSCTAARHVMTKYPWFPLSGWIYQQWCVRFEYGKHVLPRLLNLIAALYLIAIGLLGLLAR